MKYGVKLKAFFKKNLIKSLCMTINILLLKLNGTEFEHRILRNNERHDIPIDPKNSSRLEYLSVILLDSILIYPESYCSNKY